MAYGVYLSSSLFPLVKIVINWFLVFQFITDRASLIFVKAVILILKHATLLQLSTPWRSALTQSESDYQEANIDWNIQQYFMVHSSEHSIEEFVAFIMATDIGSFILASASLVSD